MKTNIFFVAFYSLINFSTQISQKRISEIDNEIVYYYPKHTIFKKKKTAFAPFSISVTFPLGHRPEASSSCQELGYNPKQL